MLTARIAMHRRSFVLDAELSVSAGEVLAVLGPNGVGKSTLLRAIAGLEPLAEGRVSVGGDVWEDHRVGIRMPPATRRTGVVFQDLLLFDHLSVRDNVAFGPRSRGVGRPAAARAADVWLERLGLSALATRRPGALSGGEAQRVALARALASEPSVLLLDEPLSALDVEARTTTRVELGRHLREVGVPTLLVTHDPLEALALADRAVVLEGGRVAQSGSPLDVLRRPRSSWAAELAGVTLLVGAAHDTRVVLDAGGGVTLTAPAVGRVGIAVPPSAVRISREPPPDGTPNAWRGPVAALEPRGERVRLRIDTIPPITAEVPAEAVVDLDLATAGEVWAVVPPAALEVFSLGDNASD